MEWKPGKYTNYYGTCFVIFLNTKKINKQTKYKAGIAVIFPGHGNLLISISVTCNLSCSC